MYKLTNFYMIKLFLFGFENRLNLQSAALTSQQHDSTTLYRVLKKAQLYTSFIT